MSLFSSYAFSSLTYKWYHKSFFGRLIQTFDICVEISIFSGIPLVALVFFLLELGQVSFRICSYIYDISVRLPHILALLFAPITIPIIIILYATYVLAVLCRLAGAVIFYSLATALTLAASPIVALVHGIVYFQKKSLSNDIGQLVSLNEEALDAFLNSNIKKNDHTSHTLFETNLLFLDSFPDLPPNYRLTIYETSNELLFHFNFPLIHAEASVTKSYLLNEQNSKSFAALLKTDGGFVSVLQKYNLLDKVTHQIKNPYDKLAREMREIIDQTIKMTPFLPAYSVDSIQRIHEQKDSLSKSDTPKPASSGFFKQPVDRQSAVANEAPLQKAPTDVLSIIYEYADISKP